MAATYLLHSPVDREFVPLVVIEPNPFGFNLQFKFAVSKSH